MRGESKQRSEGSRSHSVKGNYIWENKIIHGINFLKTGTFQLYSNRGAHISVWISRSFHFNEGNKYKDEERSGRTMKRPHHNEVLVETQSPDGLPFPSNHTTDHVLIVWDPE